jgi:hypothetical protein
MKQQEGEAGRRSSSSDSGAWVPRHSEAEAPDMIRAEMRALGFKHVRREEA